MSLINLASLNYQIFYLNIYEIVQLPAGFRPTGWCNTLRAVWIPLSLCTKCIPHHHGTVPGHDFIFISEQTDDKNL